MSAVIASADPIVVTLQFDAASHERFQRLRRAHFPPSRDFVPAHLTLFHALPGTDVDVVMRAVGAAARRAPFRVTVDGLMPLGRGAALRFASAELFSLRDGLARAFAAYLTAQDREPFRPHVTIQNKVSPQVAQDLITQLSGSFTPFDVTAEGVQLWHYRGGPWEPLAAVAFVR